MKELIVISLGENTLHSVLDQVERYLGNNVAVRGQSIEKGITGDFKEKVVLVTSEFVLRLAFDHLQGAKKIVKARRALRYDFIEPVFSLKEKTDVLLVNDTKESCLEAINQLKSHGFQSLTFHPYYPGVSDYMSCQVAITPGENQLVPKEVVDVIDIGNRQVDITTITEIMFELDLLHEAGTLASSEFVSDIIGLTKYLSTLNQKLDHSNLLLTTIFDKFPKALLFCDGEGVITYSNEKMKWLLEESALQELTVGKFLGEDFDLMPTGNHEDEVVQLNGSTYIVSVDRVENEESVICYLLEFENYDTFKELDSVIRSKIKNKKFVARYDFHHLYSRNDKMMEMIELAKRMAKRHSAIMIQGESGTGKELLAQAIHNESLRSNQPFVPVNFAALSPSILESELFGYEEGAFTGAVKGGKRGMFEEAHNGTIFMDEIGDAPLDLQVKLLRVLQEGCVRRVGGNEQVPIDIRIIAATNINLEEKVREGTFRQDLYYRLNILPLNTLPLRERREDILPLMHHYLNTLSDEEVYHANEYIEKAAVDFLVQHPWPGNVRELINVVEYIVSMKLPGEKIALRDLPRYLLKESEASNLVYQPTTSSFSEKHEVLILIYKKDGIGRRKLVQELKNKGIVIGEGKVKSVLRELREYGFIEVNKGVRGCTITEIGAGKVKALLQSGI
ncbi:sigma 54-interacting transcriptional regulator [Alkalihalobacillus macyae]|uniref:sigma-54 interaction domain-containing protein n=1 Tax=Guptibacillus hwajinpoensis TaxID=208199 RepID=UPI00273C581E|nr:sigma 54-interacting transcriptional regulator [Alkalihalobacillus macyae]MDP4551105.1 sigma 54-interacting transcriptional regulator [Alkalihalobacillus macyae]